MENVTITKTGQPAILLEPRDLRIGNILLYMGKYVHVTLLSMDIDDEYEETIGFCEWGKYTNEIADWNRALCAELKPIPLTPEILEKCGFEKTFDVETGEDRVNGYYIYKHDKHYQFDAFLNEENHFCLHFLKSAFSKHPQYLHELQNSIFILTGEELQIDLK